MPQNPQVSWQQLHRLGQMMIEAEAGNYRAHHTVDSVRLRGALDLKALNRAWHRVQRQHIPLRCGFVANGAADNAAVDGWVRKFRWRLEDPADPHDLTVVPSAGLDDAAATHVLSELVDQPFELARGPMARLVVLPLSRLDTVLALVVDHLVSDFWSLDVLTSDLSVHYDREVARPAPSPLVVTLPYPEQVRRENAYLESTAGRLAIAAVAEQLKQTGPIPAMRFAGYTGAAQAGYDHTGLVRARLDAELRQDVFGAARRARMSPWSFIHAALHHALGELSDQPVVATTMHTANRESPSVHRTVGWLTGKVVVTSTPAEAADTTSYLNHFSAASFRAFDSSEIPWPRMIAECTPDALGRHSAIPYVSFNPQTRSMRRQLGRRGWTDCEATPFDLPGSTPDAAVVISLTELHHDIAVTMYHRCDWYPAEAVENLWQTVVRRLRHWVIQSRAH